MLVQDRSELGGHHHPQLLLGKVRDQEGVGVGGKGHFRESSEEFEVMIREYGKIG
jgi:hypothetical protein